MEERKSITRFRPVSLLMLGFVLLHVNINFAQQGGNLEQIKELINNNDYRKAIEKLDEFIKNIENNPNQKEKLAEAYFFLVKVYHKLGEYEKVEENSRKLFKIDIDYPVQEEDEYLKKLVEKIRRTSYQESMNEEGFTERRFFNGIVMVQVPAGNFEMGSKKVRIRPGSTGSEQQDYLIAAEEDEWPEHEVVLSSYWIGKYEVTIGQYKTFVSENKNYHLPNQVAASSYGDECPVFGITWHDAAAYCQWFSTQTGKPFILPTEAQWEKAARIDVSKEKNKKYIYPWGNNSPDCEKANYNECGGKIRPVGAVLGGKSNGKSPYGLHDMAGNVWEWCTDWYSPGYYRDYPQIDPGGPASGEAKVLRGGCFNSDKMALRSANRYYGLPTTIGDNIGFRLCMTEF